MNFVHPPMHTIMPLFSKGIGFICLLLLINIAVQAQNYMHSNYKWTADPVLHEVSEEEKKETAIIIKDKRIVEFAYGTESDLLLYETLHKIIRINTEQGVEDFNKVFVPMGAATEFVKLQARAIAPDGTVTNIDSSNIKEMENVRNYGNFKIFAIEGALSGGEIEYLYTTKSPVRDPYGRENMQTDVLIKEAGFDLISPPNLVFVSKSYNGFPELELVENDSMRLLTATAKDVPAVLEESYAYIRANLMKVDYRISHNAGFVTDKELYGWDAATKTFYNIVYDFSDGELKPIKKILKKLKLKRKNTNEKLRLIDNYIKDNIALEEGAGLDFTNVGKILENKFANEVGMSKLIAAFLSAAKISHNLVLTSDRTSSRFDADFVSWNNFTQIMFYAPETKNYICPDVFHRYGAPPYNLGSNHGLFINKDKFEVKAIELPDAKHSSNNIDAVVYFDEDFNTKVNIRHGWSGYRGDNLRLACKFQGKDFIKERVKSGMEDAEVTDFELFNEDIENYSYKNEELYAKSVLATNSLIEKAGKSYLFKIGNIIGGQVELYQENERMNPIQMDHPTFYQRNIKFTIPKGYQLQNPDDVKINKLVEVNGRKEMGFVSSYKIDGQEVTVTAKEYYHTISLDKDDYEPFRQVINAAADFNKIVLVFEKE